MRPMEKMIDETLRDITETYRPKFLDWVSHNENKWKELLRIETEINEAVVAANTGALKKALKEYRIFFERLH